MSAGAGRGGPKRPRLSVAVTVVGLRLRTPAGLARWLERAAPASARGEVGIALVSRAHMRRLNATWRGVDRPTDVLSFLAGVSPVRTGRAGDGRPLGEIAIAVDVARRQAADHGHSLAVELRVLALHGLLHLLGYDHERDDGRMRRTEERLRRLAGLPGGLIARQGPDAGRA